MNKVVFGAVSIMDISDSTVTPETLAEGEIAYQADGEKITGTMQAGLDTSDATATAEDVMKNMTAYVNGEKITGTIEELVTGRANCVVSTYEDEIKLTTTPASKSYCIKAGKTAWFRAPLSEFGDATAEDVAKGKTFTSASGLKVVGTKEESSGGDSTLNAEVQTISDVTAPKATFNGTGGTYKVYGYGLGTTQMYTAPMYAFCGDKYYKSASYGRPTSTAMTISVDESGNISGLPSLTGGELIIVREP